MVSAREAVLLSVIVAGIIGIIMFRGGHALGWAQGNAHGYEVGKRVPCS